MIKLIINGELVDIDGQTNFPITKQMDDVDSPTSVISENSRTITLPATKKNNVIFEHIYRSDRNVYQDALNFAYKYDYELYWRESLISIGYVKFGSVKKSISGDRYSITLYGQLSDLYGKLMGKKLNEISFICDNPNLEHKLDKSFLRENWGFDPYDKLSSSIHNKVQYIPSYCGLYPDFNSAKVLYNNQEVELGYDCDEWMRLNQKDLIEFRAIRQKPSVTTSAIIDGIKNTILNYTSNIPDDIITKNFPTINNMNQLRACGWNMYSYYEAHADVKVGNIKYKLAQGFTWTTTGKETRPYALGTRNILNFDVDVEYAITADIWVDNLSTFDVRLVNGAGDVIRTYAVSAYAITDTVIRFTKDIKISRTEGLGELSLKNTNLRFEVFNNGQKVLNNNKRHGLGIVSLSIINKELSTGRAYTIDSDFLTLDNPYYRDTVVTCLPISEVKEENVIAESSDAPLTKLSNLSDDVLLPNKPIDTRLSQSNKDPFEIFKGTGTERYIDMSSVKKSTGEAIIKGRLKLTCTTEFNINELCLRPGEVIDYIYPHWNAKYPSLYFYIKAKNFADFGNGGEIRIPLNTQKIRCAYVSRSSIRKEFNMQFQNDNGEWSEYLEFELSLGRFINNVVGKISNNFEYGIVEGHHQWNAKGKYKNFFGKTKYDNHYINMYSYSTKGSSLDISIAFDTKLTQISTIDKNTLFSDDTTQLQFLNEYCKLFGLYYDFSPIGVNKVNILTRNAFYSGGKIVDWSGKIDKSKDITITPLIFDSAHIKYGYKDSEASTPLERHKIMYDTNYGTQLINTGYQFNHDTYTALSDTIFNPCAMIEQYALQDAKPLTLPCFSKINGNIREWSPSSFELLFRKGFVEIDRFLITDDTKDMIINGEYFWNQNTISADDGANNGWWRIPLFTTMNGTTLTDFGKPKSTWYPTTDAMFDGNTIFDRFHRRYVNDRYNVNTKRLNASFMLNKFDLIDFSFRNFVYYDGIYWVVNKIEFDISKDEPSKVELISVNDMDNYTKGQNLTWSEEVFTYDFTLGNDTFGAAGGGASIIVKSNSFYTVFSTATWLTIDGSSGQGDKRFEFVVAPNSAGPRQCDIVLVDGAGVERKRMTITQSGTKITISVIGPDTQNILVSINGGAWSKEVMMEFDYGAQVQLQCLTDTANEPWLQFDGWMTYVNNVYTNVSKANPYVFQCTESKTFRPTWKNTPYVIPKMRWIQNYTDEQLRTFGYKEESLRWMDVVIKADGYCTARIQSKPDWITLYDMPAQDVFNTRDSTDCRIGVERNYTTEERRGEIVFKAWGANNTQSIEIIQQAAPVPPSTIWAVVDNSDGGSFLENYEIIINGENKGKHSVTDIYKVGDVLSFQIYFKGDEWEDPKYLTFDSDWRMFRFNTVTSEWIQLDNSTIELIDTGYVLSLRLN